MNTRTAQPTRLKRFLDSFPSKLRHLMCGLRGHDGLLHFEGNRVMMRCASCGHDSPGWEITGRAPRVRIEGDARRHLLVPQRLVLRKFTAKRA